MKMLNVTAKTKLKNTRVIMDISPSYFSRLYHAITQRRPK